MEDANQRPEEDKKPEHINIKVVGLDAGEVYFKIKRTTPLKKLMESYCDKQGKQYSAVRFNYEGRRILATQTPEMLEMESDDIIEVMNEQLGG